MKIISGSLKGRKIETNSKLNYRPTLSRIREDVFNILAHNNLNKSSFGESIFADLCCGSGSIGIEALSRGAKNLYLIDNEQNSLNIVKKNLSKIKSYDIESSVYIRKADAKKPFKNINLIFDIVLIDPPYNSSVIQECLPLLKEYNLIDNNSLIFAETSKQETIDVDNFKILDTKFYGKSKLTIIKLLDLSSVE